MDITTVGHCDMVQTQNGDWWSVMLGVRPIGDNFRTLGRETFMTPVKFEGTTPVFNPGIGRVLMTDKRPNLPWSPVAIVPQRDNFDSTKLGFQWCFLRTPFENWWNISKGTLSINLRPQTAEQLDNPSLIARRQEHHSFDASAMMKFTPTAENEEAGLIAMQNDKYQFRIVLTIKDGVKCIQLIKLGCESRDKRNEICKEIVASVPYSKADVVLGIRATKLDYEFLYGETAETLNTLGGIQDGRLLSSNWAGGFIGVFVGMYASSNGQPSTNEANFDWFQYSGR
jgi:alpha-N-arabinofuranosidase